jgi:MscS family membrane protein
MRHNRIQLLLFLVFSFSSLSGQQEQKLPSMGLENPYQAIYAHLYYLQPDSYQPELAASVLYPKGGNLDDEQAERLAIQLKQIYDGKGLFVDLELIPRDSLWKDTASGRFIYRPFPRELPQIYVQRNEGRWHYSAASIRVIPKLHEEIYPFGADFLVNLLPQFSHYRIAGLALWQYAGFLILVLVLWGLHFLLSRILNPIVQWISRWRYKPSVLQSKLLKRIAGLMSIIILVWLFRLFLPVLQLPIGLSSVFLKLAKLLNLVLLMLIALRLVQIFVQFATRFTEQTSSKLDEQLMPIVRTLLQGVIIIIAIIQALRLLQVDVTALIAGISIGGLALALAAQDTVKNLIGSATIFTDQPFQIGDWIEGSGFSGTVVEVGFRTTRIRRPDSSIIAVPNGAIVNMNVQNLGMREYRLLDTTIGLTYDTPPDLIEAYIQGLHRIVEVHPLANDEGAYIYLSQLANSSLNIFFRVPINTNDYNEDLKSKHEILLAVIRLAERLGVSFAFPSTSVYVESTPEKGLAPRPDGKEAPRQIEAFMEEFKKQFT